MLSHGLLLVTLLACNIALLFGQLWKGTASSSSSPLTTKSESYLPIGVNVSVTVKSGDNVLLLVNLNNLPAAQNNYATYTIFRDNVELSDGKVMAVVHSYDAAESQGITFSFMDKSPAAASYLYSVRAKFNGIVSSSSQMRQLSAIVIPSAVPISKTTTTTLQTISTNGNANTRLNVDTRIKTSQTTDLVLVCASFSINPLVNNAVAKISLFRDNKQVDAYAMQLVSMSRVGNNRMGTFFFLDSPGKTGEIPYSVGVAPFSSGSYSFSVCESDTDMVHLSLVVVPAANAAYATSVAPLVINSTNWVTCGLSATITPLYTNDTVLITVNINFYPTNIASIGVFTIYRDSQNSQNLGDGLYGLQRISTGEASIATMSFLDSPGTTSPITYKVLVRCHATTNSFTVSHQGQTRQIAVIASNALGKLFTLHPFF